MGINFRNTLISFAIVVAIVLFIYFSTVFRNHHPFTMIWLYFTFYAGFIFSLIAAIYYMWSYKTEKAVSNKSLVYNFTGTLNWITGIGGLLLVQNGGLILILLILNLIFGFYIYKDIFNSANK